MENGIDPKSLKCCEQGESPLLGKRHENNDSQNKDLKTTALKLGFSAEEINQLDRIYIATPILK